MQIDLDMLDRGSVFLGEWNDRQHNRWVAVCEPHQGLCLLEEQGVTIRQGDGIAVFLDEAGFHPKAIARVIEENPRSTYNCPPHRLVRYGNNLATECGADWLRYMLGGQGREVHRVTNGFATENPLPLFTTKGYLYFDVMLATQEVAVKLA